ncbi:MAG: uracil-DNA glycosylase family protein [Burkholderiales bacterium]
MTAMQRGWNESQSAMLQIMGLGHWPSNLGGDRPTGNEQAAPTQETTLVQAPPDEPSGMPDRNVPLLAQDLEALRAAIQSCRACGLCEGRRQAVPGAGAAGAEWVVVGEAPGEPEDQAGEPFVGAAGELLNAMLTAAGRLRDGGSEYGRVYITHAVKCRPPGNRNPSAAEVAACAPFVERELDLVKPRLVLALGRFAAMSLLRTEAPIGKLRTEIQRSSTGLPVVVSYHPSYLLRQPLEKARAWEDLCKAKALDAQVP